MTKAAQSGFLVVADITGYSSYLTHSELEHAKDVLKTLLDLLIDHTRPPLALSGLEGDAVLSYTADTDRFEGQAFVELIEQSYVAFKRAIDIMVMNTSCDCNACANINTLDLKFLVHHGEFVLQQMGGSEELVGADVNLVHRIMKNTIVESTGFRAYTFFTQAAVNRLQIDGFTSDLVAHAETFPDVGKIEGWVVDMTPIWQADKDDLSLDIDDDRTAKFVEEYPVPPEQLWGYLTNPEHRAVFSNAKRQVTHERRNGRVGTGTVYECFHLDNSVSTNTVLEWKPFTRIVTENTAAKRSRFIAIFDLEPTNSGTLLTMRYSPLRGPLVERLIGIPLFLFKYKPLSQKGMTMLRQRIEQDLAQGSILVAERAAITPEQRDAAADTALEAAQSSDSSS